MSSKVHGLDFGSQAIASSIGETLLNNNRNGGWRLQQRVLDGRQQMSPFQRYEPKHDSIPFFYRPAYIEVTKTILRQLKSSFYNAWCMVHGGSSNEAEGHFDIQFTNFYKGFYVLMISHQSSQNHDGRTD